MGWMRGRGTTCALLLLGVLVLALPGPAAAGRVRPGTLDRGFGKGGLVFSDLNDSYAGSRFTALVRQPDGSLIIEGTRENGTAAGTEGVIERRGPQGHLDKGFGRDGEAVVPSAQGLALQGDGSILFGEGGPPGKCRGEDIVRRLSPSGQEDQGFGTKGCGAPVPFAISRIAVEADGRIVVAGVANYGPVGHDLSPKQELALARLLPDGSLDPSFGRGGIVLSHTDDGLEVARVSGLALTDGGGIAISGDLSLLRFTASGALDTGFGTAGKVEVGGAIGALLATPGGALLLASHSGDSCCPASGAFVLTRFLPTGSLDPSFGTAGTTILQVGDDNIPAALAAGSGGSIVLAGASARPGSCATDECEYSPVLARFDSAGLLDMSYAEAGVARLGRPARTESSQYATVTALAVGPDGQAFAAGGMSGNGDAFVFAREADGQSSPSFGQIGSVVETQKVPSNTEAGGIAVEPSGEIVVSAESNSRVRKPRPLLLDFKPNGSPDRKIGFNGAIATAALGQIRIAGRGELFSVVEREDREYVLRFDNHGRLDGAYGKDGEAPLPAGFIAGSFLARPNGVVIVVGRVRHPWGMGAYRLTARGHPDHGFGRRGLAVVGFGREVNAEARAALIEPDGRIVLAGWVKAAAAAARLLPNGRLDPSFGRRGRLTDLLGHGTKAAAIVRSQHGGLLLACAREAASIPGATVLLGLDDDGHRDSSFGRDGVVRPGGTAMPLALFSGKRRSVLVTARPGRNKGGVVLRAYRPGGAIDRRFGRRGKATAAVDQARVFSPVEATRQPDGRIIVAGTAGTEPSGNRVELLRFNN